MCLMLYQQHASPRFILCLLVSAYLLNVGCSNREVRLTSDISLENPVIEGTEVTLTCSYDATTAGSRLRILRKRTGSGGMDGFEDLANFATRIARVSPERPDIAATFVVSRKDDGATFICGDVETLGFQSQTSSGSSKVIKVQFDARSLSMTSSPEGGMREDMTKVITCQTDEGGSNPAVNITWRHLSPLGALEVMDEDLMRTSQSHRPGAHGGGLLTQANLTIRAHRRLNGHRIECSIERPGGVVLLRKSETLEVVFAPNNVEIHPSVVGGVTEGEVLSLICAVAVSHPPAVVRWFESPPSTSTASVPGEEEEEEEEEEITDLAHIDMTPGEHGGMLVDSTLKVSKTFRSYLHTEYRCMVHQSALTKPIVEQYQLNIFYPPTVEIVSIPNNPMEGQSVTLSCLSHGGRPEKELSFSWWHAVGVHFFNSSDSSTSISPLEEVTSIRANALVSTLNTSQLNEIFTNQMSRIPNHTGRHLILDAISLERRGWYGCQVSNDGGIGQNLYFVLINYAPRSHSSTKFIQYAQLGSKAELVLTVDARPSRAEFMWFWIGQDPALLSKARSSILSQSSIASFSSSSSSSPSSPSSPSSSSSQFPSLLRSRRNLPQVKAISPSISPWINRVRLTSNTSGVSRRITFTLTFNQVLESDLGIYMCQLNHKAGNREFYFELKLQTHPNGINPDTIYITSEDGRTRVEFEPPNSQFYSRILLRICLPSRYISGSVASVGSVSAGSVKSSGELIFLRPVKQSLGEITSPVQTEASRYNSEVCGDFEVTLAELGFLLVELDKPVTDYTFQFIVYQGAQLKQITGPVKWTDERQSKSAARSSLLVHLIVGILITLFVVCLIALLIYYLCYCLKRRNVKKTAMHKANGLLSGTGEYQTLDSSKVFAPTLSGGGTIGADIGLLHPTYSLGRMTSSAYPIMENPYHSMMGSEMRNFPRNSSNVSALTQRILSEVYVAAAKAASIAVSESIASGSMDAMNRNGSCTGTFRPGSQFADSVSMVGGSISALDGLSVYQGLPTDLTRLRKSSIARTATPTYQRQVSNQPMSSAHQLLGQTFFANQSVPPSWPSPMLTPHATLRLNEAASALAAAAAAAVLEATGTSTSTLPGQRANDLQSRFGNGGGGGGASGQVASSEDGESISSSSFFSRNPNTRPTGADANANLLQNARNTANESAPPPLLFIPPNVTTAYQQIMDPRCQRSPSNELVYLPSFPHTEGIWNNRFQSIPSIRTGEKSKAVCPSDSCCKIVGTPLTSDPYSVNQDTPMVPHPPSLKADAQSPFKEGTNSLEDSQSNDDTLHADLDHEQRSQRLAQSKEP